MKKTVAIIVVFLLYLLPLYAQQHEIDSLTALVKTGKDDSNKVNHLAQLCQYYRLSGNMDTAKVYANKAIELGKKINFLRGIATAYSHLGLVYESQSDYPNAFKYCFEGLKVAEAAKDKDKIALLDGTIGIIYDDQYNFNKALEYYTKALKLKKELGDKNGIGRNMINIGLLYVEHGDYPKALDYYFKGLKLSREAGDKRNEAVVTGNIGVAYDEQGDTANARLYYLKAYSLYKTIGDRSNAVRNLGNLGSIYQTEGNDTKALYYDLAALKEAEALGSKSDAAMNMSNLGVVYGDLGDYKKSLEYATRALQMNTQLGRTVQMVIDMGNMSNAYNKLNNEKEAERYLLRSAVLADSVHYLPAIVEDYRSLSDIYAGKGDWKKAYESHKRYTAAKDSLMNEAKSKEIGKLEAKADYDKQLAIQQANDDKQAAVAKAESKRQKMVIFFVAAIALSVAFIAIIIFRSLGVTRKQKGLIEQQKIAVEEQKTLVEQQKAIVEEKNKDITDSIRYASRIQRALLTTDDYIGRHLKEYFILFKPRDIVSGDFYWAFNKNGVFNIACCDCTGHGVPGAFMSLLTISMLNETVIERNITRPDQVLNDVRTNLVKALNPEGADTESKDGMDCAFCSFDMKNKMMYAACANNPVWIIPAAKQAEQGRVVELQPDKMPVGVHYGEVKNFTLHSTQIADGDCVYLFSDGYADQFGGAKGKKFKYKQLQELLVCNAHKSMAEQKKIIDEAFESWKGNLEQIDDILVIGIRV